MFRPLLAAPLLLSAVAVSGCAQRSCANYSVLDYLDSVDGDADLAHVGLVRSSATTRLGPDGSAAQCSIWEKLHVPGSTRVLYRPQYYSVRWHNNGWVLEREPAGNAALPLTAWRRPAA